MNSQIQNSVWDYLKKQPTNQQSIDENGNVKVSFHADKFVIFQSSIVASVRLEKSSNYTIANDSIKYVNNNGECWSNQSMVNNYKTFIGAYACVDHPDEPHQDNVGVILDAALRPKFLCKEDGTFIYYVDILVALDKKALGGKLARMVLDGSIEYMSMGCNVAYSFCSKCGHKIDYTSSSASECDHLKYSKGKRYLDKYGTERIVAELLGFEKDSVEFVEASLLTSRPAFSGAAVSRIFPITQTSDIIEVSLPAWALDKGAVQKYILEDGKISSNKVAANKFLQKKFVQKNRTTNK